MKRILYLALILFSLHASLFTLHAQAKLENGMEADIVLGQPDFNSSSTGLSKTKFSSPRGMWSNGKHLILADAANRRVLIWNDPPLQNSTPPDIVLGQPDFNSNGGGTSRSQFLRTQDVYSDGSYLFVVDASNNRVLIWNSFPQTSGVLPDVVIGQPNFNVGAANTTQAIMRNPTNVYFDGQRVYVSDSLNNRVLIWNKVPTINGTPADLVLGQPDFITMTTGTTAEKMNFPIGVIVSSDGRLVISDGSNFRILIWNQIPTQSSTPADLVVGQKDFQTSVAAVTRNQFGGNEYMVSDGKNLIVDDCTGNRVLVFNEIPRESGLIDFDFVIGQPNFTTGTAGGGRSGMGCPIGMAFDGKRLHVSDNANSRVIIFNFAESNFNNLGPQFSQGKAVVGKVFWDFDGDGRQDA